MFHVLTFDKISTAQADHDRFNYFIFYSLTLELFVGLKFEAATGLELADANFLWNIESSAPEDERGSR